MNAKISELGIEVEKKEQNCHHPLKRARNFQTCCRIMKKRNINMIKNETKDSITDSRDI